MLGRNGRGQQHEIVGDMVGKEVSPLLTEYGVRPGSEPVDQGLLHTCLNRHPTLLFGTWLPPGGPHACDGNGTSNRQVGLSRSALSR